MHLILDRRENMRRVKVLRNRFTRKRAKERPLPLQIMDNHVEPIKTKLCINQFRGKIRTVNLCARRENATCSKAEVILVKKVFQSVLNQ